MKSSLRELFEPMEPARGANLVQSGSPERLELRWDRNFHNTIDVIKALRDCGITLLEAKHTIEELMVKQLVVVDLPAVYDKAALIKRIAEAGATAKVVTPAAPP